MAGAALWWHRRRKQQQQLQHRPVGQQQLAKCRGAHGSGGSALGDSEVGLALGDGDGADADASCSVRIGFGASGGTGSSGAHGLSSRQHMY
jgi:hypothetical protein